MAGNVVGQRESEITETRSNSATPDVKISYGMVVVMSCNSLCSFTRWLA